MAGLGFRHYVSLVWQKSISDLISEGRRGYVGLLWWVIEPLLYLSVFYVVFAIVFERGGEDAVAFLLVGLTVWKWFATSVSPCSNCIAANKGLIRQVYLPKIILPFMVLITTTIKFCFILALLMSYLALFKEVHLEWLYVPVLMLVQFVMMLSIGSMLAAVVPFIPDLKLIVDNGIMLLFFLSGVFFEIASAPEEIREYLYLNPMAGLIENYRLVLVDASQPNMDYLLIVFFWAVFFYAVSTMLLKKLDKVYPKVI